MTRLAERFAWPLRRWAATCGPWSKRASPTISAILQAPEHRGFDVWHAQDGISGNALATLKERGLISGFARTVHHVDTFDDQRLCALQTRSIVAADRLFVVGRLWRDWLAREFGRDACLVGNGVDRSRFSPTPDETDWHCADALDLAGRRAGISCGRRDRGTQKYDTLLCRRSKLVRLQHPSARLVIAGGASLLDHDAYQARFAGVLAHSGVASTAVIRTGPLRTD